MNKIILLICCWTLTLTLADKPSWFPEKIEEITEKCFEKTQLPNSKEQDINSRLDDNPKGHEFFLCVAKGANLFSEDMKLNTDRLTYSFYRTKSHLNSKKRLVQDCVEQHKQIVSDGEMIFKVIKCITDKEVEIMLSS